MIVKKYTTTIFYFCITIFMLSISACAQQKIIVKKAYSFYTEQSPGNIAVDPSGQPQPIVQNKNIVVYVEVLDTLTKWDSAWVGGVAYLLIQKQILKGQKDLGNTWADNKSIIINTPNNYFLIELQLEPMVTEIPNGNTDKNVETINGEIEIKGMRKGKAVMIKAGVPIRLEGIPSV